MVWRMKNHSAVPFIDKKRRKRRGRWKKTTKIYWKNEDREEEKKNFWKLATKQNQNKRNDNASVVSTGLITTKNNNNNAVCYFSYWSQVQKNFKLRNNNNKNPRRKNKRVNCACCTAKWYSFFYIHLWIWKSNDRVYHSIESFSTYVCICVSCVSIPLIEQIAMKSINLSLVNKQFAIFFFFGAWVRTKIGQ